METTQADGKLPHHFFTVDEVRSLFLNYEILWEKETSRPMVTAKGEAKQLEFLLRKFNEK